MKHDEKAEQILLYLDDQYIDIHNYIKICLKFHLYLPLLKLYSYKLADWATPLDMILIQCINVLIKEIDLLAQEEEGAKEEEEAKEGQQAQEEEGQQQAQEAFSKKIMKKLHYNQYIIKHIQIIGQILLYYLYQTIENYQYILSNHELININYQQAIYTQLSSILFQKSTKITIKNSLSIFTLF